MQPHLVSSVAEYGKSGHPVGEIVGRLASIGSLMSDYIDTKRAAKFLGVSPFTLQTWRSRGFGPPFYTLSVTRVQYKLSELEEYMQARRKVPAAMQIAQMEQNL